jgi:hypothetical protein
MSAGRAWSFTQFDLFPSVPLTRSASAPRLPPQTTTGGVPCPLVSSLRAWTNPTGRVPAVPAGELPRWLPSSSIWGHGYSRFGADPFASKSPLPPAYTRGGRNRQPQTGGAPSLETVRSWMVGHLVYRWKRRRNVEQKLRYRGNRSHCAERCVAWFPTNRPSGTRASSGRSKWRDEGIGIRDGAFSRVKNGWAYA